MRSTNTARKLSVREERVQSERALKDELIKLGFKIAKIVRKNALKPNAIGRCQLLTWRGQEPMVWVPESVFERLVKAAQRPDAVLIVGWSEFKIAKAYHVAALEHYGAVLVEHSHQKRSGYVMYAKDLIQAVPQLARRNRRGRGRFKVVGGSEATDGS